MAGFKAVSLLAIAAASIAIAQKHVTIPLRQHHVANADPIALTLHAASKLGQSESFAVVPEMFDVTRWLGTFTAGKTQNLTLSIDTGSADISINPGLYKPSSQSVNLHKTGKLDYGFEGYNVMDSDCDLYTDVVGIGGLQATNQTFGVRVNPIPDKSRKLPHQGIAGFAGTTAFNTQLGGTPFFQQLCDQGIVPECRFGVAYGTKGYGKQILGSLDTSLFESLFEDDLSGLEELMGWELPQPHFATNTSVVYHSPSGKREEREGIPVVFDTGAPVTVAPLHEVQRIFTDLRLTTLQKPMLPGQMSSPFVLSGFYPCHSPPKLGFTIGTETFYFEPSAFEAGKAGVLGCEASIHGSETAQFWLVGQDWFQGKYVDFQQTKRRFGVATLKDKEMDA